MAIRSVTPIIMSVKGVSGLSVASTPILNIPLGLDLAILSVYIKPSFTGLTSHPFVTFGTNASDYNNNLQSFGLDLGNFTTLSNGNIALIPTGYFDNLLLTPSQDFRLNVPTAAVASTYTFDVWVVAYHHFPGA